MEGLTGHKAKGDMIIGHLIANSENRDLETALNPAWRDTVTHLVVGGGLPDWASDEEIQAARDDVTYRRVPALKKLAPNSGAYFNEVRLSSLLYSFPILADADADGLFRAGLAARRVWRELLPPEGYQRRVRPQGRAVVPWVRRERGLDRGQRGEALLGQWRVVMRSLWCVGIGPQEYPQCALILSTDWLFAPPWDLDESSEASEIFNLIVMHGIRPTTVATCHVGCCCFCPRELLPGQGHRAFPFRIST